MASIKEKVFKFDDIISDKELYDETKDNLKSEILQDYDIRYNPAKIIVGCDVIDATIGTVLFNLLIMKGIVGQENVKLSKDNLYNFNAVTETNLIKYFDKIIQTGKKAPNCDFKKLQDRVAETMDEMSDLSGKLNALSGNSVSYYDFVNLAVNDPEAKKIFYKQIYSDKGKSFQFNEIEKEFSDTGKEIIEYYKKNTDSDLYPFVASETGINTKQLTQMVSFVGLKPDIDGSVIPHVIDTNYLRGLGNIENYYINCKGTRHALITNNKMVRRSGYLTRKLSLDMVDNFHDNNLKDCGGDHYLIIDINSENKLKQFEGRHYYELTLKDDADPSKHFEESSYTHGDELKTISLDDKFLIGKTIGVKSPITCAGEHVCATCYGRELSEINKDRNTGIIAVLKLTEPLTQRLLSAKHLLSTKTDAIEWGEIFTNVFDVDMNTIYFNGEECTITFTTDPAYCDDDDEDLLYITNLKINNVEYKSPTNLYLYPKILNNPELYEKDPDTESEKRHFTISSKIIGDDVPLFLFYAKNNELTKSLQEILDLIESSDHLGISNYSELANKFDDLLIENGLGSINSVHAEMIISTLIKNSETGKELDFSKKELDNYTINRVSKSVMESPLSISLSFERLNDQLLDLSTYDKTETSMMDFFYK